MIARIWHGWTTADNADRYQELLTSRILPDIAAMDIPGYLGAELLRDSKDSQDEVEFITILRFETLEQVKAFTGQDYEVAHVPDEARKVLKRFDARSRHYNQVKLQPDL